MSNALVTASPVSLVVDREDAVEPIRARFERVLGETPKRLMYWHEGTQLVGRLNLADGREAVFTARENGDYVVVFTG